MIGCSGCQRTAMRSKISAIPRDTCDATGVVEHAGLSEAALRNGVSLYWNGPPSSSDSQQQILLMERAIERNVMGIVLTPNARFALDTVIFRALSHKIPVVVLGAGISLPPDPNLSFVLTNVQRAGELAAERVHNVVGESGLIAVTGINPMLPGSSELADAFENVLHKVAPGITIVSKIQGAFTAGQSEIATEHAVKAHPNLKAVFALSISATRGAIAAVRNSSGTSVIHIIAVDYTLDQMFLLRKGEIDSIIVQNMRSLGTQAVENIVEARRGHPVSSLIYKEPVLVTRENIDTESIQQMLIMDWRRIR